MDAARLVPSTNPVAHAVLRLWRIGVLLQRRGLQDRVALIGFDDFELADLLQPGVSVIAQDPHAIGRLAAECALGEVTGPTMHVVPTRLIERGSGEIRA